MEKYEYKVEKKSELFQKMNWNFQNSLQFQSHWYYLSIESSSCLIGLWNVFGQNMNVISLESHIINKGNELQYWWFFRGVNFTFLRFFLLGFWNVLTVWYCSFFSVCVCFCFLYIFTGMLNQYKKEEYSISYLNRVVYIYIYRCVLYVVWITCCPQM